MTDLDALHHDVAAACRVLAARGLAEGPVVMLRGHGLTSTGGSPAQAVLRALAVDGLARMSLDVVRAGGTLVDLPAEGLAELPDLGSGLNEQTAWRHELARLGESAIG